MAKPVVAFVCTHNACRSQIAEAMAHQFASDVMLAHSAETRPAKNVNPDAVRLLASEYGSDIASLEPKSLSHRNCSSMRMRDRGTPTLMCAGGMPHRGHGDVRGCRAG